MDLLIAQLTELFDSFFGNEALPGIVKWGAIAVALLFVELLHRAWMVLWFSLGALSAGIASIFFPDDLIVQFGVFFAVSAVSLAAFVYYRHHDEKRKPPDSIIQAGRKVRCTAEINGTGEGLVLVDGISYKARLEIPGLSVKLDEWVEVCGFDADELTALVKPIEESQPQVGN